MKLPHILIYTDRLPANVGGRASYFVIRIRPKYKDDPGIHAHEKVHVNQWWTGVLIGAVLAALLYFVPALAQWHDAWPAMLFGGVLLHKFGRMVSDRYTLWCEVQAYREQARHYPDDRLPLFADYISYNYGLSITPEQAYAALTKD